MTCASMASQCDSESDPLGPAPTSVTSSVRTVDKRILILSVVQAERAHKIGTRLQADAQRVIGAEQRGRSRAFV